MSLASEYTTRVPVLTTVGAELESLVKETLRDIPRVDSVSWRVKGVGSLVEKAARKAYTNPLYDIQDQLGMRIVVLYKSDVKPVTDRILSEFREIENRAIEQPDPEAFSYEARHLVCLIPPDIRSRFGPPIDFFELQVSTVFQHAWAQANHDVGYKSKRMLAYDDKRRIAWAAAQAWGADMIFDELWRSSAP